MRHLTRVHIEKCRVEHSVAPRGFRGMRCYICDADAHHRVLHKSGSLTERLPLCTKHFVQMFKTDSTRHPKKPRIKYLPGHPKHPGPKEFRETLLLTQHMRVPYVLHNAVQQQCHGFMIGDTKVFYTLWKGLGDPSVTPRLGDDVPVYAVTLAVIFPGKQGALNFVQVFDASNGVMSNVFQEGVTAMVKHCQSCLALLGEDAAKLFMFPMTIEATRFLTQVVAKSDDYKE